MSRVMPASSQSVTDYSCCQTTAQSANRGGEGLVRGWMMKCYPMNTPEATISYKEWLDCVRKEWHKQWKRQSCITVKSRMQVFRHSSWLLRLSPNSIIANYHYIRWSSTINSYSNRQRLHTKLITSVASVALVASGVFVPLHTNQLHVTIKHQKLWPFQTFCMNEISTMLWYQASA